MNVSTNDYSDQSTLDSLRFWPLLILNVFSLFCSLFLLILLLSDRTLRTALHNHLIIILLIVNLASQLIDNPAYLTYLHRRQVWPATHAMCIVWIIVAYQFYVASTLIVALASVQRHILIFYQRQLLSTSRRRFFAHYLPIILLLLYLLLYGVVVMLLLVKDNYPFDFSARTCGGLSGWILNYPSLSIFDTILNGMLPAPVITIASVALLLRVVQHKKRIVRRMEWQKQRKMTIQLLSISCLFIVINLPPTLIFILRQLVERQYLVGIDGANSFFGYLSYYQCVLLPFVCSISLWKNAKPFLFRLIRKYAADFGWPQRITRVYPTDEQQRTAT